MSYDQIAIMTTTDKNCRVCEALGICWHEWEWDENHYFCPKCGDLLINNPIPTNPDFAADPLRLLAELRKREDWWIFAQWCKSIHAVRINAFPDRRTETVFAVETELLLTPGALLDAVWEWIQTAKGRKGNV
jgi:hypothetical protein